jgi:hypothetical protein
VRGGRLPLEPAWLLSLFKAQQSIGVRHLLTPAAHVPTNRDADATITLKKVDERVYSLDPFPFASDRLTLVCRGRYVAPFPEDFLPEHVGASLYALPVDRQIYALVPAR